MGLNYHSKISEAVENKGDVYRGSAHLFELHESSCSGKKLVVAVVRHTGRTFLAVNICWVLLINYGNRSGIILKLTAHQTLLTNTHNTVLEKKMRSFLGAPCGLETKLLPN